MPIVLHLPAKKQHIRNVFWYKKSSSYAKNIPMHTYLDMLLNYKEAMQRAKSKFCSNHHNDDDYEDRLCIT